MMKKKGLRKWDRGITFESLLAQLMNLYNQYTFAFFTDRGVRIARKLCYSAIGLIQLRNGLRAQEAIDSFYYWLETKEKVFYIRAKKHGEERPVKIPAMLKYPDLFEASRLAGKITMRAYGKWVERKLGVNTHTLRYAFIRKLLDLEVPGDKISLVLGHRKPDTTYEYEKTYEKLRILEKIDL